MKNIVPMHTPMTAGEKIKIVDSFVASLPQNIFRADLEEILEVLQLALEATPDMGEQK
jgi:hypothetical protein